VKKSSRRDDSNELSQH